MNLYKTFLSLLPQRPLQVGTVSSTDAGVATIQLPGGGIIQARGDVSNGDRVFVRDGVIEGNAPDLPFVAIDI